MDYRIFNVRTDVIACDCTRGCTDTVSESALKFDSGRKILCRTGESNLRRLPARQMLYQLSYIPTPLGIVKKNVLLKTCFVQQVQEIELTIKVKQFCFIKH